MAEPKNKNVEEEKQVSEYDKKWALLTEEQKAEFFNDDEVEEEEPKKKVKLSFGKKAKIAVGVGVGTALTALGVVTGINIGKKSAAKTAETPSEPFTTVE